MAQTQKEIKKRYFEKKLAEAKIIKCACGCGVDMKELDNYARPRKYLSGHNTPQKYEDPTEYKRAWNHRNQEKRYVLKKLTWRRKKVELIKLKGCGCMRCPIRYNGENASIFHLHHREPSEKSFSIGNQTMNKAWSKILTEVEKCDLLCANCHEMEHSAKF